MKKIDKSYRIDVYLVGNSEIKDLNSKFLNNNYETDVLSFNFYEVEGWGFRKIRKFISR